MSTQENGHSVYVTEDKFSLRDYQAGEPGIVATTQVPRNQVWKVDPGKPLVVTLVHKQTVSVAASTTASKTLDPAAPVVDYLPDPRDGNYNQSAFVTAYIDPDQNGSFNTLVTDTTEVSYTGTWTTDQDFVEAVELNNSATSARDVEIYTVYRYGYAAVSKRTSGRGNASQELKREDAISWAFANPDAPNSDRQITWSSTGGLKGILPPKYRLEIVYYDQSHAVTLDRPPEEYQVEISLPVIQRNLKPDEDPDEMRTRVARAMTQ